MFIRIATGVQPVKIYTTMPSESELQGDIDADYANNRARTYILPAGNLTVTGTLLLRIGTLTGQGWNSTGTKLVLGDDAEIKLQTSTLNNLEVVQSASATKAAVTNIAQAGGLRIRDVKITGGNASVYALKVDEAYEFDIHNVRINTSSNGAHFPSGTLYNTGDALVDGLRINLLSDATVGIYIEGSTTNTITTNNIQWNNCYVTAGGQAGWVTGNCIGLYIKNGARHVFNCLNIEELPLAVKLEGYVDDGGITDRLTFVGGWIYKNVYADGIGDTVYFFNTYFSTTNFTGDDASKVITVPEQS